LVEHPGHGDGQVAFLVDHRHHHADAGPAPLVLGRLHGRHPIMSGRGQRARHTTPRSSTWLADSVGLPPAVGVPAVAAVLLLAPPDGVGPVVPVDGSPLGAVLSGAVLSGAADDGSVDGAVRSVSSAASDRAIDSATTCRILSKSGSPGWISGGTNDTLAIGVSLALRASSSNAPVSDCGTSVTAISSPAFAIAPNLVSTVAGSSCFSIAAITHFCRAIRA